MGGSRTASRSRDRHAGAHRPRRASPGTVLPDHRMESHVFSKVMVANRAEIAVRGFRAAYELGARTVAVFAYEDRNSEHRLKADESYPIGVPGHPVRAYLDINEIIRVARHAEVDAIYPGYGFLSENSQLARACREAGITFIGPPPEVLDLAGNKVTALAAARAAGIPVLQSSAPSDDAETLLGAEIGRAHV